MENLNLGSKSILILCFRPDLEVTFGNNLRMGLRIGDFPEKVENGHDGMEKRIILKKRIRNMLG